MVGDTRPHRGTLERRAPTLFIVSGVLLLGHAVTMGVEAFTGLTPPPDVFAPAGHLLAIGGLFGLSAALAGRRSTLARGAAAVVSVAGVGWAAITASQVVEILGVLPGTAMLPAVLPVVVLVSTILTYVLFGLVSLRSEVHQRAVGGLLLVPAALLVVLLANAALAETTALGGVVIGGGQALAMLAIGYALRTGAAPAERAAPDSDVTAG